MNDKIIYKAIALGMLCSVAFISGYVFRGSYGGDNQPIMNAIRGANGANEVMDLIYGVQMNMKMYDDISSINSIEKIKPLQDKYRANTLRFINNFEKQSKESISERRRSVLSVFDEEMIEYKKKLGENP
jgi:hypothetical protein